MLQGRTRWARSSWRHCVERAHTSENLPECSSVNSRIWPIFDIFKSSLRGHSGQFCCCLSLLLALASQILTSLQEYLVKKVIDSLKLNEDDIFVDVGGGTGNFTVACAKAVGLKQLPLVVDIFQPMLDVRNLSHCTGCAILPYPPISSHILPFPPISSHFLPYPPYTTI